MCAWGLGWAERLGKGSLRCMPSRPTFFRHLEGVLTGGHTAYLLARAQVWRQAPLSLTGATLISRRPAGIGPHSICCSSEREGLKLED